MPGGRRNAALRSRGVSHFVFPVRQLVIMAGLAGVVAAIAPSTRAARLDILRAVDHRVSRAA